MVHITATSFTGFGLTEQVLTLFPSRDLATEFFPDEVQGFLMTFKNRADKYLSGGHVTHYTFDTEETENGRVIVRVTQHVG